MIMLALGAEVTSVEPASDFAAAIHESAVLNCFSHRHRSVNAFACEKRDHGPRSCMRPRRAWNTFRYGGGGALDLKSRLNDTSGRTIASLLAPWSPPGASAETRRRPPTSPTHYDLLKLDGDGPEGGWLRAIEDLLTSARVSVMTMVVEGNNLDASVMSRLQRLHGYDIYRLDDGGDDRRHVTPDGWDQYSERGTMESLESLRRRDVFGRTQPWARDALEVEMFSLRAMRHVWRVKSNASKSEWRVLLGPLGVYNATLDAKRAYKGTAHQWVLTMETPLTEPVNDPRPRSVEKLKWRMTAEVEVENVK